eukprot:TRINITY_DN60254_c0_g1_i1.p1 TRINITY_DN60254_c0_g1~~TRINITY_DN60254_c0_g1_i1.p1  ORF type:complete len:701 (+),score=136.81 TRINITY_DN60254_c0_g1_i1:110-2104(+)
MAAAEEGSAAPAEAAEHTSLLGTRQRPPSRLLRFVAGAALVGACAAAAFLPDGSGPPRGGSRLMPSAQRAAAAAADDAAALTPCQEQLHRVCGSAQKGTDNCTACTHSDKSLEPSGEVFCEKWDLEAFCRPAGAPAEPLAPVQRLSSTEPATMYDFVVNSYALCRHFGFTLTPAYVLTLRASLTAFVLCWLSITFFPIGTGDPSIPGPFGILLCLVLTGKGIHNTFQCIFLTETPAVATTWWSWYEIHWWAAMYHPSFCQVCCVVAVTAFGWFSCTYSMNLYEDDKKRAEAEAERIAQELEDQERWMKHGAQEIKRRASADVDKDTGAYMKAKEGVCRLRWDFFLAHLRLIVWDWADWLQPVRTFAALGGSERAALKFTCYLACGTVGVVVVPLLITHILPMVFMIPSMALVGLLRLNWWRMIIFELCDCLLAGAFVIAFTWFFAFLGKQAVWMLQDDAFQPSDAVPPGHPFKFAARAVFVQLLCVVAAMVLIVTQDSASQAIILQQKVGAWVPMVYLVPLIIVLVAQYGGCREDRANIVTWVVVVLFQLWALFLVIMYLPDPAAPFDARITCADAECNEHHLNQDLVDRVGGYFELIPLINTAMLFLSPVTCFYGSHTASSYWGAMIIGGVGIMGTLVYYFTSKDGGLRVRRGRDFAPKARHV